MLPTGMRSDNSSEFVTVALQIFNKSITPLLFSTTLQITFVSLIPLQGPPQLSLL